MLYQLFYKGLIKGRCTMRAGDGARNTAETFIKTLCVKVLTSY